MSEKTIVKTIKLQSRLSRGYEIYTITVPRDVVKRLGWEKGDTLLIKITQYEGREAIVIYKP